MNFENCLEPALVQGGKCITVTSKASNLEMNQKAVVSSMYLDLMGVRYLTEISYLP